MNRYYSTSKNLIAWWDILFGVWLAVSPFVLNFSHNTAMAWNNVAVGIAVAALALLSRSEIVKGALVLTGAWLFAATFVLGFMKTVVVWNNLLVALLVIVGALLSEVPAAPVPRRS
jgi:hypothetical protein